MFIALFVILLIIWLVAFAALHITSALIHLLLLFAAISLIVHFVRGSRSTT